MSRSLKPGLHTLRKSHRDDRGQATFEFMLMLPLFILLVLFAVDMAIIGYEYVTVSNAVREGARYASVNCGTGDCTSANEVKQRAADASNGGLDLSDISVGWPNGTERGDAVVVSAEHSHSLLFFPVSFPVVSCTVMRLEADNGTSSLPATPTEC